MLIAVVGGLAVGMLLGMLGGGGSILAIPLLVYGIGMDAHDATTASLVIVGLSSIVAIIPYARAGNVLWRQGLIFGLLGIAGSWLGSTAAHGINPDALLLLFAGLLFVVGTIMFRRSHTPSADLQSELPNDPKPDAQTAEEAIGEPIAPAPSKSVLARMGPLLGTATLVGALTGFFGVGGGFAIVPSLVLILGVPMRVATGTSILIMTLNTATTFGIRATQGIHLDWPIVGVFTGATIVASLIGAAVAGRLPARRLQLGFAIVLFLIATVTLVESIIALR